MILEDILNQAPRLTTHEQLLRLEAVSRALRADRETRTTHGSAEQLLGVIAPADHLTDVPPAAAALAAAPSTGSGAGSITGRHTAVDATAFRQQVRRIFRAERSDNYMAYASILANLAPHRRELQRHKFLTAVVRYHAATGNIALRNTTVGFGLPCGVIQVCIRRQ